MENSESSKDRQLLMTKGFNKLSQNCREILDLITKTLGQYEENINNRNFHLEMDFDLLKINTKFLNTTLSSLNDYSAEGHKINMLKLYDFTSYEFKRLRNKYEEMNEFYFNIDEENKYTENIKNLMVINWVEPTEMACLYLRMLYHYLDKIDKRLKKLKKEEYKATKVDKEKFIFANNKLHFLSRVLPIYIRNEGFEIREGFWSNEIVKFIIKEFNEVSFDKTDYLKWASFVKNLIGDIFIKVKSKGGTKSVINAIKRSISSLFLDGETLPSIRIVKILFEALESKMINISERKMQSVKCNEVFYLQKRSIEDFIIISEKELQKRKLKNLIKIRILSNHIIKVNYDSQNYLIKKLESLKFKEFNFFGLLLRVSKEILTPVHNVILHVPGGGFFSGSSESHLNYLSDWAKATESVIISIDYKLSNDNKYPILLDECIHAYEAIVENTAKLFSKINIKIDFNINKIILYSDSVGSLIAMDLIKHAIKNKIKTPDEAIFVFPIANVSREENKISKLKLNDPFSHLGFEENIIEMSLYSKFYDSFLTGEEELNDDRLNFFLTEEYLVSSFPRSLIISSGNEPIREDCRKFASFLKSNGVPIQIKNSIYYCNGFLQNPSLFDSHYKKTLNYILKYILEVTKDKQLKTEAVSESSSQLHNSTESSEF